MKREFVLNLMTLPPPPSHKPHVLLPFANKKAHPINAGKPPALDREQKTRGEYSFRLIFWFYLEFCCTGNISAPSV